MSEDEAAAADVLKEFEAVKSQPCSIDGVNVYPPGLQTRLTCVLRELRKRDKVTTLDQVLDFCKERGQCLDDLGVFSNIQMELAPGLPTRPGTCSLNVHLEEKGWRKFAGSTHVLGDGRIEVEVMLGLRNLSGNCEHHSLEYRRRGSDIAFLGNDDNEFMYRLRFPRILSRPYHVVGSLLQKNDNCHPAQSYREMQRGTLLEVISSDGSHRFGAELSWLQLADRSLRSPSSQGAQPAASSAVRQHLGDHVKTALTHTVVRDHRTRDPEGGATSGYAFRVATELSGFTPDSSKLQFVKSRLDVVRAVALGQDSDFTLHAALGAMMPILGCYKNNEELLIRERFLLGGTSSLRGFAINGVGPHAARGDEQQGSGDALGGDVLAAVRASMNFVLPFGWAQRSGLKGHVFGDTGSLAQVAGQPRWGECVSDFWSKWRLSFGVGVVVPLGTYGRLELNFVQPLNSFEGDRLCPGFQVGFASDPFMTRRPSTM